MPHKGSRSEVGVQGSRRRPKVVAFVSASVRVRETGVLVAKGRTAATFGLAPGPRVSEVSTGNQIGGVLVAKR